MTEKRFIYCEEENGEFPFPYIKYDGKEVISLYECVDLLNEYYYEIQRLKCQLKRRTRQRNEIADFNVELMEENKKLKKALWEAEKNYIEEKCEFSIDIEKLLCILLYFDKIKPCICDIN